MHAAAQPVRLDFDDYHYTETHPSGTFELLDGVIYSLAPEGDAHVRTRSAIQMYLSLHLDLNAYTPWTEASFPAAGWTDGPRPENLVARGPWLVNGKMAPRPHASDVALIIEVSSTSRRKDTSRSELYARLGISEFWLVDLESAAVIVHRDHHVTSERYQTIRICRRGETIVSDSVSPLSIETDFLLELAGH